MISLNKGSNLWNYLSEGQKDLIEEGLYLVADREEHPDLRIKDHSYLVFPFAKAYEGFLKQLFLDMGFITQEQYQSNHFRIGRALNPHLERHFRDELVFDKLAGRCGNRDLAGELWDVWKKGRNLVFHYFPHNLQSLTEEQATDLIGKIISAMEWAVNECASDCLKKKGK